MKKILNKSGETLVEALVSITVLIMAGAVASSMIISSMQQMMLSEDYLIAQNLAYEGVEAIKDIRGTNAMLYPSKPECWMILSPDPSPDFDCTNAGKIAIGEAYTVNYGVADSGYNHWYLEKKGDAVGGDIPTNIEDFLLYLVPDENGGDFSRYLHIGAEEEKSRFYRAISVKSVNGDILTGKKEIRFNVYVRWLRGAKENVFQFKDVALTNYAE